MPSLDKVFTLSVTVEQFLNACSDVELQELDLLLPKYLKRIPTDEKVDSDETCPYYYVYCSEKISETDDICIKCEILKQRNHEPAKQKALEKTSVKNNSFRRISSGYRSGSGRNNPG